MKYQKVGRINRNLYHKCVTLYIITQCVILLQERKEHIQKRHPGTLERFLKRLQEILSSPTYLLEGNRNDKPNRVVILKVFPDTREKVALVLELKTLGDNPNHKNAIITMFPLEEKDWNHFLDGRTKILFKARRAV